MRTKRGFDREDALRKLKEGGMLSRAESLRCRVKYFSDGMVLGSKGFVEEVFQSRSGFQLIEGGGGVSW